MMIVMDTAENIGFHKSRIRGERQLPSSLTISKIKGKTITSEALDLVSGEQDTL
ncbi:hypothetical protein Plhal703r1_c08g0044651 [Plasmopara halstedii]